MTTHASRWWALQLLAVASLLPLYACGVSSDDENAARDESDPSSPETEYEGPNSGLSGSRPISEGEEVEVQPRREAPSVFVEPGPGEVTGTAGAGGADDGWSSGYGLGHGDLTVLLILDKSGSMAESWDGNTRWNTALNSFFGGLAGVEDQVTVGAILFPQRLGCEVDGLGTESQFHFQSGRRFVDAWDTRASSIAPGGSTPLGLAFEKADVAIAQAEEAGIVEGRRFRVMIVTDGEPNCGTNPDRLVQLATQWREKGVEVHVMGLPGSTAAAQLLDRIAGIGGTETAAAPTTGNEAEDTFYAVVR